jgi:hypothetical protein
MKNSVLACLLVLLIAPACRKAAEPGLTLAPPAWQPETLRYEVTIGGEPAGFSVHIINPVDAESVPALELSQLTTVTTEDGDNRDSTWLLMRRADLKPLHAFRTIENADGTLWSEVSYGDTLASVQAMTPMGAREIELPLTDRDFDNDQLTTLLRALEIAPDDSVELSLVVGLIGAQVPVLVMSTGAETVVVRAGTFEARHIELGIAEQSVDLWYETGGRKRMLRYHVPGSDLALELLPATDPAEAEAPASADKPQRTGR